MQSLVDVRFLAAVFNDFRQVAKSQSSLDPRLVLGLTLL
jgi:hypothetical protein